MEKKFSLGFFPTPLQRLENLSKQFDGYTIFIKRDDHTGLASGGNKTRKLEYLLQQAIDTGCDTIITGGAQQSNHCRQTAAASAIAGLDCHLVLGGAEREAYNGNLLLSHLLGAHIHFSADNRKGEDMQVLKESLETKGKKPFLIPYGGSNSTGALGFVHAVKELKEQLKEQNLSVDYIFFASSSGGTLAGLLMGKELFGLEAQLMPINIDKNETYGISLEEMILNIINEGKQKLAIQKQFTTDNIRLIKDYDKPGYGVITQNEKEAIKLLAQTEGILLDPVYTGRAFFGMMDYLKKNKIPSNSTVLFWHTGGLPATFACADQVK